MNDQSSRDDLGHDYRGRILVSRPLFFSSTFRDLLTERDLLRDDAFLELNERLRRRRHELNVVDLRQGIEVGNLEDDVARDLMILKVCLDEIKRTRPFLIGLIGDRYGWIPPAERMQAAAQAAGFELDVAGRSVTELELMFAFLSDPQQRRRSHIFIRELDYAGMPDAVRRVYDERAEARDGTPQERREAAARWERLESLKARLRREYPDRVHTYTAHWDSDRGRVAGLEGLRSQVIEHLGADLDAETAQYEQAAPRTWQEADVLALEDFVLGRTRHYVERPDVTGPALDFALGAEPEASVTGAWGLCITGEAGHGKSAIFARLYQELMQRQEKGGVLVLAAAAGIQAGAGLVDRMLRRWIGELAAFLAIEDPLTAPPVAAPDDSDERSGRRHAERTAAEIEEIFASLLGRAAARTRVVVLLDALNQFERTTRGRYLTWLPVPWPHNARLLATAIPGIETESLVRNGRRVEVRPVPDIDRNEALAIAKRVYEERYHRAPNQRAVEILLDKRLPESGRPAHANPLWLELVLQEINLLEADDFERAQRELAHLPAGERIEALLALEAEALPPTVRDAYGELLGRAERTFGQAFTRAVLACIACGRSGWRQTDLQALVPAMTGKPWDDLAFAGVRRSLGHHLVQRGEAGLWDFFHAQLRRTALERYLGYPAELRGLHGALVDHLQSLPADDPLRITETMVHLVGHEDRRRAALYLAGLKVGQWRDPAGAVELAGAVAGLVACLEEASDPQAQERLTQWLAGLLESVEDSRLEGRAIANVFVFDLDAALGITGALEVPRGRLLESTHSVLERLYQQNPNDAQAARDLSISHNRLGDFYLRRGESGDADRALEAYQQYLEIAQRLYQQNPNDAQAARDLSISHNRLGDFYLRRGESGDADRALEAYQQYLEIAQRLYQQNPNDAQAARDLSISHNRLGDFYLRRGESGDADRALEAYQQYLEIAQRLYQQNPNDAQAARDLSISHNRLGDFYLRRGESGDADRALEAYQQYLEIAQRLYQQNPNDAQTARDLSISHNRLGDFYLRRGESGDADRALEAYQQYLEIAQRLYQQNPNDAQAARNLSISLIKLGDFYLRRGESGDADRALEAYQQDLEIAQRLYQQNPNDAQAARDLSISHNRLGDFYLRRGDSGDADRALEAYQQDLEIAQRLCRQNPNDAQAARDLSISHNRLGDFYLRRGESGDADRALEAYQQYLEIAQRLYQQNPNDAQTARDLVISFYKLASYYSQTGCAELANDYWRQCRDVLQGMRQSGFILDPPLVQLLERLEHQSNDG